MGWPSVKFIQDRQFTFLPPTCLLLSSSFVFGKNSLVNLELKSVLVLTGRISVVLLKATMFCVLAYHSPMKYW